MAVFKDEVYDKDCFECIWEVSPKWRWAIFV